MKASEDAGAERPHAAAYARAQLVCREVREDLVALGRDELSPLRAESVHQHLASCPECREEALELELAVRSLAKLPEVSPPAGLASRTVSRVMSGTMGGIEGVHGRAEAPVGAAAPAPGVMPGAARTLSPSPTTTTGGNARSETPGPSVPPPADAPRPAETASGDHGWADSKSSEATRETVILPRQLGVFRRQIRNPFVRAAVAAVLFLAFDGVAFMAVSHEGFADAVGRAHHRVLGPNVSEAVHRATDAFLARLRL